MKKKAPFSAHKMTFLLLMCLFTILEAQRAPLEVNVIVGGSALLSVPVHDNIPVKEVRWKRGPPGPAKMYLGHSKGREFVPYGRSPANYSQLTQRLDMYNETTLRIRNLTKGDGGGYKADAQFSDGTFSEEEFQLNVYDPVPDPQIETKSVTNTSDGCNIALDCQPSNATSEHAITIAWFQGNMNERSHVSISNGRLLNVSLKAYRSSGANSTYTCFISNPADRKHQSIALTCPNDGNPLMKIYVIISIVSAFVLYLIGGVLIYFSWKKKKQKKGRDKACSVDELRETRNNSILYADISLDHPDRDEQGHGRNEQSLNVLQAEMSKPTIYDEVCVH